MSDISNYLLITAAICMLVSLGLAWIASLIVYVKVAFLKRIFVAPHQLIRAHIDYLLMMGLLILSFYLIERLSLSIPDSIVIITCIGALYNPFGFIMLAMKPKMANPETAFEKARVLLGFLPATIGYGYISIMVLASLMS